jgi:WhiB family redox-sensing transcriptional regulator
MLHTDEPTPCQTRDPELWFSRKKADVANAKALCLSCPLRLRCLEEALETEALLGQSLHGIHGALTPAERTKTKLKRIA